MRSMILLALFGAAFISCVSAQIDSGAVFVVYNVTTTTPTGSGGSITSIASVQTLAYGNFTVANMSRDTIVAGANNEGISNVCSTTLHPCNTNATCTDRGLSLVECSCNSGYNDTSTTTFSPSSLIPAGTTCSDIDECAGNGTVCGAETDLCTNSPGTYTCTCNPGYQLSASKVCEDIDECATSGSNNCSGNATCTNTAGAFTCSCNDGFSGDGVTCTDIDECMDFGYDCGTDGTCSNNNGSYICNCNTGYTVNGTIDPITCIDIDECTNGSHSCHTNAMCTNTNGSFTCSCNTGYTGTGMSCTDIDECAGAHGCHANATCANNAGSFVCSCNTGFSGNGTFCEAARNEYDYRAVITVSTAITSGTTSLESKINDLIGELANNTALSYQTLVVTVEQVVNGTTSQIIVLLAFNGTSHNADDFTALLKAHTASSIMIDGGSLIGDDYDECTDNYGNCSASATCTNTNGTFSCVCSSSFADQSTSGVNGTICNQPVNFTCFSDRVEVWALSSFFVNSGVTNVTAFTLGTCSGSDDGSGYWKFIGSCDGVTNANSTHISTQWNFTNRDPNATIVVGSYFTYPVSCLFPTSANVTFNFTAEQSNFVAPDQESPLADALDFQGEFFTDSSFNSQLAGPVGTDVLLYFRMQARTTLNPNLRLRCENLRSSSATNPSSFIDLMSGGCPVAVTPSNAPLRNTLNVIGNGNGARIDIGFSSHFHGSSTTTTISAHIVVCSATGGASCEPSGCTSGRRRRSAIIVRAKRQEEEVEAEVTASFQRDPEDACNKNCGLGICVLDAINTQQCVCTQQTIKTADGFCVANGPNDSGTPVATTEDQTTLWILVGLAVALILLIAIAIVVFAFKRQQVKGKDYELNYVNTNAISK